ncbi:MAG: CDP-archaeol synthase [Steroidobacteraceae bacterium]
MTLALQLAWLALPLVVSGLVHLAVMKYDWLPALRARPMDFGATLRGRRVFGDNKTWRGAFVTVGTVTASAWLLSRSGFAWFGEPSLVPWADAHPVIWGLLLGGGYILGELPNSFLKRQLGIAPGANAAGLEGRTFWVVDQLDSLAGILACTWSVWHPSPTLVALLVAAMLVGHPLAAWVMVRTGLKRRVG